MSNQQQEENKEILSAIQTEILEYLRKNGHVIRRSMVRDMNHPRTTLYDNLLKLQKMKLVEKYSRSDGDRGRPLVYWKIK